MRLFEVPAVAREALALMEAFRRLNYPSRDLSAVVGEDAIGPCLFVEARWGDKTFIATAGPIKRSETDMYADKWPTYAIVWNEADPADALDCWERSRACRDTVTLVAALQRKGMLGRTAS